MKTVSTWLMVPPRILWWLFFAHDPRKLDKIRAVFRAGGIRLCWHYALETFHKSRYKYNAFENQLPCSQSELILAACASRPLISIVVPVYRVDCKWLNRCIDCVRAQHYTNWELLLVDDGSQQEEIRHSIDSWASQDARIKPHYLDKNLGISEATNVGIKNASGDFIGFLDHDDELTPDALTWIIWVINKHPDALWLYSDEDKITKSGRCHRPHFKPDFSVELLLSNMFTCHLSVYAADILKRLGGLRRGFEGAQDHDLALRVSEIIPADRIVHIPRVLYHWRDIPGSTAAGATFKPDAPAAGRRAVEDALQRRGLTAEVSSHELCLTIYRIELMPRSSPNVAIIIPTRNSLPLLKTCIRSIRDKTRYSNYQISVVDNQSTSVELQAYLEAETLKTKLEVMKYDKPFNHSEINNMAVNEVDSDLVVFMNNDVEILSDNWLEQLVATVLMNDSIAIAGGTLLYPNGTVQHGGIILGLNGTAGHAHKKMRANMPGYFGRLHALQEFSGITAALAIIRKSSFAAVGGFDVANYPTLYNDVDLCIRLRRKGFRCLYNPMVRAIHHESGTRRLTEEELSCKRKLVDDYAALLQRDPFYNPNLSLDNEQFHGFRAFPVEEQIAELRSSAC